MDLQNLNRTDIIAKRGYRRDIQGDAFSLFNFQLPGNFTIPCRKAGKQGPTLSWSCAVVSVSHWSTFLPSFRKAIGVEIDPVIASHCKNNLAAAGRKNAKVICGDVNDVSLLERVSADVVIYDIPYWYGIEETNSKFVNPTAG
ncbi:MAG: class I SAM-dependent methyltransferase [Bacteroidota bacterium]